MTKNLSRDPPRPSAPADNPQIISDPWEVASSNQKTNPVPETWKLPIESHPLIRPAGIPVVLRLSAPKLNPIQVLLEDGLKLKAYAKGRFQAQLNQALALIYWLGTTGQETAQA